MHILVHLPFFCFISQTLITWQITNDDGPPCPISSPFVHSLVHALQSAGHLVSVILPSEQRSWIGKAHFADRTLTPSYFCPGPLFQYEGIISNFPPLKESKIENWILIDSTPASCVQIGLHHYFQHNIPVDMVVSGPNLGRNSTTLFSLSSRTIGAAMEAALCGKKSVALSFAHFTLQHDPAAVTEASNHAVRLVEHFNKNWPADVDLFSINIPLQLEISQQPIMYARIFKNRWSQGVSTFVALDAQADDANSEFRHQQFQWAPQLNDIRRIANDSGPGNDAWVVEQGYTSVTPLQTNFMHSAGYEGEIELSCIY